MFKSIYIHPLTYLLIIIAMITANFKKIIIYMSLIFVHELGHFLTAKYYRWNTDKIYIYPLGGITRFNDLINKSLKEELIIILMGPLFQIIFFLILVCFKVENIAFFNWTLLLFNLLPIYPLDGGKILNILLACLLPYKTSYIITIHIAFISYFLLFIFLIINYKSLFLFIVLISLVFKIMDEYSKRNYYFNKFLLERYLNNYRYKKIKYITTINSMSREKTHFILSDRVYTEKEILKKYFKL